MIAALIYSTLEGHAPLAAIVGDRIFRDVADDAAPAPYVIWQLVGGTAANTMDQRPVADRRSISIETASPDEAESDTMTAATQYAMEGIGVMTSAPQSLGRDELSKLFRYTFTIEVFRNR